MRLTPIMTATLATIAAANAQQVLLFRDANPNGRATPSLFVPALPLLAGLDLCVAAMSLDATIPAEREITNWIRTRLRL